MKMIGHRVGIIVLFAGLCLGDEVFLSKGPQLYSMDYQDALERCASLGAHLATKNELRTYPKCSCGWTLDKTANYYVNRTDAQCGVILGLHECTWSTRWHAYCFRGAVANCSRPLGIESGTIHKSQMYASSELTSGFLFLNSRWSASIARLNNKNRVNAWIPQYDGRRQWLEVDLEIATAVTGIVTQGASKLRSRMWVESFTIQYSKDGANYKTVQVYGPNGNQEKVFEGNSNNDGLKRNMFPEPLLARYIRFRPRSYHGHIALRLELLGCDLQTYVKSITPTQSTVEATKDHPFLEFPPEDSD